MLPIAFIEAAHVSLGLRGGGIHDVSFSVDRGERLAIFGPPGCGKSLLLSILTGRVQPDEGRVTIFNAPPQSSTARIGIALQGDPRRRRNTPRQVLLGQLAASHVSPSQRPARLAEALHISDLYEQADRPCRDLSETAVVSLTLAAAAASRPDVLILDDLVRLLSPDRQSRWWAYLDNRRHADGLTIVHATMDSREAEAADRVLLLDQGRAILCDHPNSLLESCAREEIVVDAADVDSVERTLRGIAQVEVVVEPEGIRFMSTDGSRVAAHLSRHPVAEMRGVFVRRPDLWDCLRQIRDSGL